MKQCSFCWHDLLRAETLYQLFTLIPANAFCAICQKKLIRIDNDGTICLRCGKKQLKAGICEDCQYWETTAVQIIMHRAIWRYNDFIVDVLWQIKHNRDIHLIRAFYPAIKQVLQSYYALDRTLFIPIPTDLISLQQRHFNLIEFVFHELTIPLHIINAFKQPINKRSKQHTSNKRARLEVANERFNVDAAANAVLAEQKWQEIVIIDDVYTTGSTMIKALKSLPFCDKNKVSSFTLFR